MEGFTVQDLIDILQELKEQGHGDKPVCFTYNYGDHWGTVVAQKVDEVEAGNVEYSEYHRMYKLSQDEEQDEVVVIS